MTEKENMMFKIFQNHNVRALFSTRADGSMSVRSEDPTAQANRSGFLQKNDIDPNTVVSAAIAYSSRVAGVGYANMGTVIPDVDGLCTTHPKLPLTVTMCDCLPIYVYAPGRMIGMVHAGWQPIQRGIIAEMMRHFFMCGCKPTHVLVGVGPGIGPCHFEVKEDVAHLFRPCGSDVVIRRGGALFIDLKAVVRRQLLRQGVLPANIEIHPDCTYCREDLYFSFRRDRPEKPVPMLAVMSFAAA